MTVTQIHFLDAPSSAAVVAESFFPEVVGVTLNVASLMQRVLNEIYYSTTFLK